MRRRTRAILIASAVVASAAVVGTAVWGSLHPVAPRATPVDDGTYGIAFVTPDRGDLAPAPPDFPDGVLGTAAFALNDAKVTGHLSFVLDGGLLTMRVDSLGLTPLDSYDIRLLAVRVDPGSPCVDSGYHETFSTGAPEVGQNEFALGPIDDYWRGDPTYLDVAVITQHVEGSSCLLDRIAYAPILWTVDRTSPDIDVDDSGATVGAAGEVFSPQGTPLEYRIAAGDTMTAVAARLGMSDAELDWLNPRLLYPVTGRNLNLDPLNR